MITDKVREAFPDVNIPEIDTFYSEYIREWCNVYEGKPNWDTVKRAGLAKGGKRRLNTLNTGKLLCEELSHKCFAEQVEISVGNDKYENYITDLLNRESFWRNIPQSLSKAFAYGGCVLREYLENGAVKLNYIDAKNFIPTKWDNKRITEGIFTTATHKGKNYYTLYERHTLDDKGVHTENRLFCSSAATDLGERVSIDTLYPDMGDFADFPGLEQPLFQYFKPDFTNNKSDDVPLGISCYANALDTLKALDVAFDSFAREFVLGKKRIIVPSSCIRMVTDVETGNQERYFDADDEVYQALKCDDTNDLKITDNTVELRIEQHVSGINALLNILCSQVGLSAGSLSFDAAEGTKTATEVISQDSKTALTLKCNKNLIVEFLEDMLNAVIALAVSGGILPASEYKLAVGFKDNVIIDDNTMIDNNIKLVAAGLKSRLSAVMEILKCDEATAQAELDKINAEQAPSATEADLLSLRNDEESSETVSEVAEQTSGKSLNGAQTQSLIAIISQYQAGTLSIGQAVNIVSAAIGVSKEESKKIIEGLE